MQWQPLNPLSPEPYKLSREAAALFDSINAEIATVIARRSKHDGEAAALTGTGVADFTSRHVARVQAHQSDTIDVLRLELGVRQRVQAEWLPTRMTERQGAQVAADERKTKAFASVAAKLVSVGYVASEIPDLLIAAHPTAWAAYEAARAAQNLARESEDLSPNGAAIGLVTRDLERRISQAMGGMA